MRGPETTSTPATSTPATSTPATSTPATSTPATSAPGPSAPATSAPTLSVPIPSAQATSPEADLKARLKGILRADPLVRDSLQLARGLGLPDWYIASGAVYQTVWNALTGKPSGHGLKDIDLIYYEATDLSWEAEDRVIKRADAAFEAANLAVPVEIRNQARVHLWYEQRFGAPYAPLSHAAESLTRYASTTHAVAVRLEDDDSLTLEAPFGLADIFSLTLRPNPKLDNKGTYDEKGARCQSLWSGVTVIPWPQRRG